MTTDQIIQRLTFLVRTERKITNEILQLIIMIEDRGVHLETGYPSLYEFLTKKFGYSSGAAQRRIEAARQLRVVPEISEKLESGELTLTNVARARQAMREYEKVTGEKLNIEEQAEVLSHMEGKTSAEAEQKLFAIFPETADVRPNSKKRVSATLTRLMLHFNDEQMADLEWTQNFLSHAIPDRDAAKIFGRLLKEFRRGQEKKDERAVKREQAAREKAAEQQAKAAQQRKAEQDTSTAKATDDISAANHRAKTTSNSTQTVIGAETPRVTAQTINHSGKNKVSKSRARRVSFTLASRRCEFVDAKTGRMCNSAVWIESDHIEPKALGGGDEIENRRCLCHAHNQYEAKRKLNNLYWRPSR